jgi:ABC-type branched-subunit amino acid transport system substrate-binding protein
VYVSLPLSGPAAAAGREVLLGARLALERSGSPAELVVADTGGPWETRDDAAIAFARRAVADERALAVLGDFYSSQVHATAWIHGEAELLQVAPVATWWRLGGETLVRLMPDDRALARGIAEWIAERAPGGELLVVHDHDDGYGVPVGRMCVEAARERGIEVRSRPVWDHDEDLAGDVAGAGAVLYAGVAGSGAVELWHGLHALQPGLWLLGTDGVAAPWLARALSPEAAARTRFFDARRAPWGFSGFAAMELILEALAAGGGDRAATARDGRDRRERDCVLGRYALDADGLTTAPARGRLAVVGGELVWD